MDARKRKLVPYACEGWEKNCKESSPFCRARERGEAREKLEGFYSKICCPLFFTQWLLLICFAVLPSKKTAVAAPALDHDQPL